MKKYLLIALMIIGYANVMLAQEDFKQSYIQGSVESITDNMYRRNNTDQLIEATTQQVNSISRWPGMPDHSMAIYGKLLSNFGYSGTNSGVKFLDSDKDLEDKPMSKFQLIVDEKGKIIDCTMLASTDTEKDKAVLESLKNEQYYDEIPKLNGEPCKSLVLLSFLYHKDGKLDVKRAAYPLLPLPESDATTAS